MIAERDADPQRLYPPESNHLTSVDQLRDPNVLRFAVQDQADLTRSTGLELAAPMAIAAVRLVHNAASSAGSMSYGEIKRLDVPPIHRGQGLAKALIARLEAELRDRQIRSAKLETGIAQPAAIALYACLGYRHCSPVGPYTADPLSVFLEKDLGPGR